MSCMRAPGPHRGCVLEDSRPPNAQLVRISCEGRTSRQPAHAYSCTSQGHPASHHPVTHRANETCLWQHLVKFNQHRVCRGKTVLFTDGQRSSTIVTAIADGSHREITTSSSHWGLHQSPAVGSQVLAQHYIQPGQLSKSHCTRR